MKEFLFIINDIDSDNTKFAKVTAANDAEAKSKFAKAFTPFLDLDYSDLISMAQDVDIRIYYSEIKDIVVL